MEIKQCFLTKNRCYQAGKKITPKGIMVHSTGANNPNLKRYVQPDDGLLGDNKNNNDWNNSSVSTCVHAFIGLDKNGDVQIYQTLPWDYRGWHAGGDANNTHISFEICEDGLTNKDYFDKVFNAAVELCVYLCKKYNLDASTVICHSEGYKKGIASNHADVMHWFPKHGKSMYSFRKAVKEGLTTTKTQEAKTVKVELPILKKGSKGNEVKTVQRVLKQRGWTDGSGKALEIDGSFGAKTEQAVKKFQKFKKSSACDGIVGQWTWEMLLTE